MAGPDKRSIYAQDSDNKERYNLNNQMIDEFQRLCDENGLEIDLKNISDMKRVVRIKNAKTSTPFYDENLRATLANPLPHRSLVNGEDIVHESHPTNPALNEKTVKKSNAGLLRALDDKQPLYLFKPGEKEPYRMIWEKGENDTLGKLSLEKVTRMESEPAPVSKPGWFKSLLHSISGSFFKSDFDAYDRYCTQKDAYEENKMTYERLDAYNKKNRTELSKEQEIHDNAMMELSEALPDDKAFRQKADTIKAKYNKNVIPEETEPEMEKELTITEQLEAMRQELRWKQILPDISLPETQKLYAMRLQINNLVELSKNPDKIAPFLEGGKLKDGLLERLADKLMQEKSFQNAVKHFKQLNSEKLPAVSSFAKQMDTETKKLVNQSNHVDTAPAVTEQKSQEVELNI